MNDNDRNSVLDSKGSIYIRDNEWWKKENVYKMGKADFAKDRESPYITGEPIRGEYVLILEMPYNKIKMRLIDNLLKQHFQYLNVNKGGGTEFYERCIKDEIIPFLDKMKIEYVIKDVDDINRKIRKHHIQNKMKKLFKTYKKSLIQLSKSKKEYECKGYEERDYQIEVINYGYNNIIKHNAVYIYIPTGTGKTYCGYKIIAKINPTPPIIVIFSPRKIVNQQNISNKYLSMLNHTFINYSNDKRINIDKPLVISCCIQSEKELYEKLKDKEIFVWFDEAHWGIEDWIKNMTLSRDYWFRQRRLFTSASPNKEIVTNNVDIFGTLYSLNVSTCIQRKWLAPIKPFVYSEDKKNVNKTKYILVDFKERKRTWGFCFYNDCENAKKSFENHVEYYKNKQTDIKPFLLISEKSKYEPDLDYGYDDIKIYEKTPNSIGYVVAQYSMGYDFKLLDFIHFGDPKISIKDIIQSIGRGLRPDCLDNGKNLLKELFILLPIFQDEMGKYENIIEVMRYLLDECGLSFDDIIFKERTERKENTLKPNILSFTSIQQYGEDMKSMLFDLLCKKNASHWVSYKDARIINIEHHISCPEEYDELCKIDKRLPQNPEKHYKVFDWLDYIGVDVKKYYTLDECKIKVKEYINKNSIFDIENSDFIKLIHNDDYQFPPNKLWLYVYKCKIEDIIRIPSKMDFL